MTAGTDPLSLRVVLSAVSAPAGACVSMSLAGLVLADPAVASTEGPLLGVLGRAVRPGQLAPVVGPGGLVTDRRWAWPVGVPLYVTSGGVLATTPPGTGWVRVVGRTLSPTTVVVTLEFSAAPAAAALTKGGLTGQVLTKVSATDWDCTWSTPSGGGGGSPNLDGGTASSVYGGIDPIDGGGA